MNDATRNLLARARGQWKHARFNVTTMFPELDPQPVLVQAVRVEPAEPLNETTRRYARTLHGPQAAFPRDPEYGDPVDPPCDPMLRFESFLDWIDARWRMWFLLAGLAGASLGIIALYFTKT